MGDKRVLDIFDVKDESGKIRSEFRRKNEEVSPPDGQYDVLREDGTRVLQINYRCGEVHGPYLEFWSNGVTACTGTFENGMQEGIWTFFRENGSVTEIISFREGKEFHRGGSCHS